MKDNNYIFTAAITTAIISTTVSLYLIIKENRRKKFAYNKQRIIKNESLLQGSSSQDNMAKINKIQDDSNVKIMTEYILDIIIKIIEI